MDPLSSAPLEALEYYGFRRFNRPHLEPADCSEQVQHSGHSKVGGGAPGYALEVRKCIRADEPILPSIFIAPETLPRPCPATSAQNTQLGLIVMSAPNTASVKHSTAASGASASTANKPAAARPKPSIAGSRRDHARRGE